MKRNCINAPCYNFVSRYRRVFSIALSLVMFVLFFQGGCKKNDKCLKVNYADVEVPEPEVVLWNPETFSYCDDLYWCEPPLESWSNELEVAQDYENYGIFYSTSDACDFEYQNIWHQWSTWTEGTTCLIQIKCWTNYATEVTATIFSRCQFCGEESNTQRIEWSKIDLIPSNTYAYVFPTPTVYDYVAVCSVI